MLTPQVLFVSACRRGPIGRSLRVSILVAAILVMSVADLQLTLLFASGSGMAEGNPLARFIMQRHEPWMLMAWKGLLVGLTCTILLAVRRTRAGEAAAWICCLVLSALSLHWSSFAERMTQVEPVMHEVAESSGERWVRIPDVR